MSTIATRARAPPTPIPASSPVLSSFFDELSWEITVEVVGRDEFPWEVLPGVVEEDALEIADCEVLERGVKDILSECVSGPATLVVGSIELVSDTTVETAGDVAKAATAPPAVTPTAIAILDTNLLMVWKGISLT